MLFDPAPGEIAWTPIASDRVLHPVRVVQRDSYDGQLFYLILVRQVPDLVLAVRMPGTLYASATGDNLVDGPRQAGQTAHGPA